MIRKFIQFIKTAGAKDESDSPRDGFLSYSAETHSISIGVAVGILAIVTGNIEWLGIVVGAVLMGAQSNLPDNPHFRDIVREPAYTLAGCAVGVCIGYGVLILG